MQHSGENIEQAVIGHAAFNSNNPCAGSGAIDFDEEAEAHVVLFSRLMHYVRGESDFADGEFGEHRQPCALGKWLQEKGVECFGDWQAFRHLREIHEQFHRDAESVLSHLRAGSWTAAEQACKRELSLTLRRVLVALTDMSQAVLQQEVALI